MAHGNPSPPAAPMEERDRLGGEIGDVINEERGKERSVFNQLHRTRQWEADGTHLLRPAAFHAWAARGWAVTGKINGLLGCNIQNRLVIGADDRLIELLVGTDAGDLVSGP